MLQHISGNVVYPDTINGSKYIIDKPHSDTLYNITVTSTYNKESGIFSYLSRTSLPEFRRYTCKFYIGNKLHSYIANCINNCSYNTVDVERFAGLNIRGFSPIKFLRKYFCGALATSVYYHRY